MVVRVGVVAVQGAVSEHIEAFRRALREMGVEGEALPVRRPSDLDGVDALAIPGGESTTISRLLLRTGLFEAISRRAGEGMPVLGTCAGLVLLAREGDEEVERSGTRLMGLMDMTVRRNAFGRQRESFEVALDVRVPGEDFGPPFPAVFIRAPAIARVWGGCRDLARARGAIVLAEQGSLIAAAFHPELTSDSRIHRRLLAKI
ncbi:MAG: pyridoxal 5'-phosphate synthase glutaminase subunit PdxT [Thermoplasmatota archaeon]